MSFSLFLIILCAGSALSVAISVARDMFESFRRNRWNRNPSRYVGTRRILKRRQFNPHRYNMMGR